MLILLALGLSANGQRISNEVKLKDGSVVDTSHVFMEGEDPTFSTVCDYDLVYWKLMLYADEAKTDSIMILVDESSIRYHTDTLNFDDINWLRSVKISNDHSYRSAYYFYDPVTATATYKGVIAIYDKAGKEFDRVELTFNLPPGIPRISSVSYSYEIKEITSDMVDLNGVWTVNARTKRATTFYFEKNPSSTNLFTPPNYFLTRLVAFLNEEPYASYVNYNDVNFNFSIDGADWGLFLCAFASNKYGCTHSPDTLCSTDYITDPDVLEVINRLKERAGVGYVPENRDWTLKCDGRTAAFGQEALALIRRVWLCDVYGRIYESDLVDGSVDISMLPKGFNAIIVETSDNRRQTFKVVRR